ncbi:MAG: conjugal transfer protein TraF [Pelovirga sp.]
MSRLLLSVTALLFLFACTSEQPPAAAGADASATAAGLPQLVFFLDPGGRPCQLQDQILRQMSDRLEGRVTIRPVSTAVAADRGLFAAYGIRALPTLLLADSAGQELRRLSPGIQSAETIERLLAQALGE